MSYMLTQLECIEMSFKDEISENEPLKYFLNPRLNGPNEE